LGKFPNKKSNGLRRIWAKELVKSLRTPPFSFSDAERFLSRMSHHSVNRVHFKRCRDVVEAFDVIVGSEKPEEFDECWGKKYQCCRKGTLLPRILLALVSILTFIIQGIYLWVFTWNYVPQPMMLPTLVGFPIIGFILVFWLEAFVSFQVNSLQPTQNNLKYAKCLLSFTTVMLWSMVFIANCQFSGWIEELTGTILIGVFFGLLFVVGLGVFICIICRAIATFPKV
jgi:hypothetical protein